MESKNERALFHPKICRSPIYERNIAKIPIGDFLHSQQKQIFTNKEKQRNELQTSDIEEHYKLFTLAKSEGIINQLKTDSFISIFNLLDKNRNGIISSLTISLSCFIY